ncbi:hypothetical protein GQ53DRAFT_816019 [Thozetella sp. PMI_491]|nr:hypothetical protein GQ53DRAFT_816019 [Thozetella sp. PMI_491]
MLILLMGLSRLAAAQDAGNYTSLFDALPQLVDLQTPFAPNPAGGQNFTRCCLQAVYDSYQIVDGEVVLNPDTSFVNLSAAELNDTSFPCGASFNGSLAGSPVVNVPFSWCSNNCRGWQVSSNTVLTQWIQPFVGFILPAAVFCLNVPRRKGISISDGIFRDHIPQLREHWRAFMRCILGIRPPQQSRRSTHSSAVSLAVSVAEKFGIFTRIVDFVVKLATFLAYAFLVMLEMFSRATVAALIALLDTVFWLAVVFSAAAPMTLSGLYEGAIDKLVLQALEKELRRPIDLSDGKALRHRVHLFYGVLVGNLVLADSPHAEPAEDGERSAWQDIERLVELIPEDPSAHAGLFVDIKRATHVRLSSMLGCQASFGATVGVPVVFFLGSFLFSIFQNLSMLGDNDTSHALAFGEWWMTIPYVAVVSGCLLAGNNPNTLEAIYSGIETWEASERCGTRGIWDAAKNFVKHPFGYFYDAVYQPVWMWERGRNKRKWISKIQRIYNTEERQPKGHGFGRPIRDWARNLPVKYGYGPEQDFSAPIPSTLPDLDFLNWIRLLFFGSFLIICPFVLAFLTSYYTPHLGLSCRSTTFMVYFCFQVWLSALWFWDFPSDNHFKMWHDVGPRIGLRQGLLFVPTLMGGLTCFGMFGSMFTTILGTLMQLVGMYRNCRCVVPVNYWLTADFISYMIPISTNSPDSIYYARRYWMLTGWLSIAMMIAVCYVSWWYQRHWRRLFYELIDTMLVPPADAAKASPRFRERVGTIVEVDGELVMPTEKKGKLEV